MDETCEKDCTRCSGEHCDVHGYRPCECDVIDRHRPLTDEQERKR